MFASLEMLDQSVYDHLEDCRFYSQQSWVLPAVTNGGKKIHDVVIVGGGQSGLTLTYNLRLRGIRRVVVVDSQQADKSGPWSSFARMPQLRSPKALRGPECSNPLLSFKAWFCSKYSRAEYEEFDFVPLEHWREYLSWYRRVLGIDTVNDTAITDIEWDPAEECFVLTGEGEGQVRHFHGRKICLATGMTAAGRWAPPEDLVAPLPRESFHCAWEQISWQELAGKDVAVIGAGASGFDNASWSVDAGCRSVTVFGRSRFPEEDIYLDLWRGRDDSGVFSEEIGCPPADILEPLLAHNAAIDDRGRMALIGALFKHGRCPVSPEYLSRVGNLDRMTVLDARPVDELDYVDSAQRIRLRAQGETFEFDRVIFATAAETSLACRPELARFSDRILTWGEVTGPEDGLVSGLEGYPKLSPHFQLQPRDADDGFLGHIYSLADIVHITVGLQSLPHVIPPVARHIGQSLFEEQLQQNVAFIESDSTDRRAGSAVTSPVGGESR